MAGEQGTFTGVDGHIDAATLAAAALGDVPDFGDESPDEISHFVICTMDDKGRRRLSVGGLLPAAAREGASAVYRVFGPGRWCYYVVMKDGTKRNQTRPITPLRGAPWAEPNKADPLYYDLAPAPPVPSAPAAVAAPAPTVAGGVDLAAVMQAMMIAKLTEKPPAPPPGLNLEGVAALIQATRVEAPKPAPSRMPEVVAAGASVLAAAAPVAIAGMQAYQAKKEAEGKQGFGTALLGFLTDVLGQLAPGLVGGGAAEEPGEEPGEEPEEPAQLPDAAP